ncbi:LysR family transcriptional regulator [Pectobacterium wasabiae]|uniref:Transcriptional regulator n=1 Tax=Pectobacterium wasabiae TaxID=55208 RepID=A0AAW3EHY1_9GAMM|nr:LysR family transcriptional regulator [Pectobacterium wasabiae]AOR63826.1 transcriptional regulator [Pectobacterium wasabiae CFBP 3304]EJS94212.1 Transcriptional regulator LysR [Pectobacterium wasabiae CFBP 3304]KFX08448.1 transcriptional regulator [Pectobacterium wasabiae]KGA28475.1 transcriptional regulator [Pectobacterium wasabiae]
MGQSDSFDGLAEFLAIAKRLSIRKAALDLGKTPGSMSLSLQRLEHRLGVLLFHRTTRKMALTEAGEDLLLRVGPAALAIVTGFEDVAQSAKKPSGTLKLIVERLALPHVIEPLIPAFRQAWPNLNVDITVSNRHDNFVSEGYDAGIMIGSYIEQDMIAIRLSPPFQWAVFGSPDYFKTHGKPKVTSDLVHHECIRFRRPEKGDIYRWEFIEDKESVRLEPMGTVTVNDGELMRSLAVRGVGLIYSSTFHTSRELADGTLEAALLDLSPGNDGLFLYFSRAARNQPKLRAFIDVCSQLIKT